MKQKTRILIYILIAAAVVVLGVLGVLSMRGGGSGDISEHIDLGRKYLIELSYDKAVIEFTEAINIDPNNVDAYLGLAEAYEKIGDIPKAIEWLENGFSITGDPQIKEMLDRLRTLVDSDSSAVTEGTAVSERETAAQTESETKSKAKAPDLSGMTAENAAKCCEEANIKYKFVHEDNSKAEKDTVIGQSIDANEEIPEGETLVITLSSGIEKTDVPDLSGMTEEEVITACEAVGLTCSISYTESDTVEKGFVVSQSIPAGASVAKGISIPVTVSKGAGEKYTVELVEAFSLTYDENGERKLNYDLKSNYDFSKANAMAEHGVDYPYICKHGNNNGAAASAVWSYYDDPTYDSKYEGEMYYSIETGAGSVNLSPRYYYVSQFSEGLAFFMRDSKKEGKTTTHVRGYINTKGEEVFSYLYTDSSWGGSNGGGSAIGFSDSTSSPDRDMYDMCYGYAAYENNSEDGVGVVDSKGNVIIKPSYYSVDVAGNGIFRVTNKVDWKNKYGYITAQGKEIAKCEFDCAGEFINGLAAVGYYNDGKYTKGVIDQNGEWVVPCKYEYCLVEDNGLIVAFNDDYDYETYETNVEFYCYDKNGNQIFNSSYFSILTGNKTGCGYTLGEANDRILAQDYDGTVYLYDLSGKLIAKTKGELQYERMLHGGGGSGPWSFLFDITGIVWLGGNTYMDKDGNLYSEHPYGLPVGKEYDEDTLASYYTTCEPVSGYENIYRILSEYENIYYYFYKITPNK